MEWISLGHASWLALVGELRVLFDPVLLGTHHGGVFELAPGAAGASIEALRPDFVFVSHQHPDHFDVRSLRRLAALDPETVVFTADALVAHAASRVGFRDVQLLAPLQRVDVGDAAFFTTPSAADFPEWGALVVHGGAAVWNQVDTVFRGPAEVRSIVSRAREHLGFQALSLLLARWQPLLEIAAPMGEATGFPFDAYGRILSEIAAAEADAIVPSSAGSRHAAPFDWMNRFAAPVPRARAARDIARATRPGTRVFAGDVGASYRVGPDGVACEATGGAAYVHPAARPGVDPGAEYAPLELPPLADPNPLGHDEGVMRAACERWIARTLAPALGRAYGAMGCVAPLRFVVRVVFPAAVDDFTITASAAGAEVARAYSADYDALNAIGGSMLFDVIEGRRHWGEPLLAGQLRAVCRAYDVTERGLARAHVGPTFLYYGLSYAESVRRMVEAELG